MAKIDSGKPRYIGETKDQLRDGFGVYLYPNSFFRYEGEWRSGVKHGHGKLAMKDGSFYEGQFVNGEIEGMGVKSWSYNGNMYEGQFVKGELCGQGIMRYGNGDLYEGGWMDNKREGEGVLTEANGYVYRGSFHKNKKHGEGTQYCSNDEQYEGSWVCGMRQGHGIMKFSDGSIYGGQWRSDMFNGQGSFIHCSGISYEGIWINGRPELEATEILISGSDEIDIEQGQSFNFEVEIRTADGELPPECGRVLQITAGIKVTVPPISMSPKHARSTVSDLSAEDPKENLISTPFGFDVEPYPLAEISPTDSQQTSELIVTSTDSGSSSTRIHHGVSQLSPIADQSPGPHSSSKFEELSLQDDKEKQAKDSTITEHSESDRIVESKVTFQDQNEERFFPVKASLNPTGSEDEKQDEANEQNEQNITVRVVDGKAFLENLSFPSLQVLRRPISRSSPESIDGRISAANKWKKSDGSVGGSSLKIPSNTGSTGDKKKGALSDHGSVTSESDRSKESRDLTPMFKKKKERKDDKLLEKEDKFCKPGDYVVIVQDATYPPFLDTTLKPAFLHVKVMPRTAKRSKSREIRK